jgi:hypothetical protein
MSCDKISEFLRNVLKGEENVIDVIAEVLGDAPGEPDSGPKRAVTVALQNRVLQPEPIRAPERMESPPRAHEFHDVHGFCEYIQRYGGKGTVILGNADNGQVLAVLDENAGHGRERINLRPIDHPLLSPWIVLVGSEIPVREFAEFIILNRRVIIQPEAKPLALLLSQIRLSKEIEVQAGRGATAVNGIMIKSKIQGVDDSRLVDLPDSIAIEVPVFFGMEPTDIEFDLLICSEETDVTVKMVSSDLEAKRIEAFQAMIGQIESAFPVETDVAGGPIIGLGDVNYTEWAYLGQARKG